MWRTFSYLLVFFHVTGKIWRWHPLICILPLVPGVSTHCKNITPMSFWVYHVWLGVCIQVNPLFHHQQLSFPEYWYTGGLSCPLVFSGRGLQWVLSPHNITLYFIFMDCGVFMHRLGGGTYLVCFHPWWWILLFTGPYLAAAAPYTNTLIAQVYGRYRASMQ